MAYWQARGVNPTPDLVTTSGSGYDPDITQQDALVQIPMVSKATGLSAAVLRRLVISQTQGAQLGFLGTSYIDRAPAQRGAGQAGSESSPAISAVVLRIRTTLGGEVMSVLSYVRPWVRVDAELGRRHRHHHAALHGPLRGSRPRRRNPPGR